MTDPWIELHVFGSYPQGEGIILRLPGNRYAVIDSCSNPQTSMIKFLKDRSVEKLYFVCLTHPHADHFTGLKDIVSSFEVEAYFASSVLRREILTKILAGKGRQALGHGDAKDNVTEFLALQNLVANISNRQSASPRTKMYPLHDTTSRDLEIYAYSPFSQEEEKHLASIGRGDEPDHNLVSLGLCLIAKKFSVFLCGDVGLPNWNLAVESGIFPRNKPVVVVKVGHHSSKTSNDQRMWDYFSTLRKPQAATTGYRHLLPDVDILQLIHRSSEKLICTNSSVIRPRMTSFDLMMASSRSEMSLKSCGVKVTKATEEKRNRFGRCSFLIDKQGNVTTEIAGDACELDAVS